MDPQVLLWDIADLRFDHVVEARSIRRRRIAGKVFERRVNDGVIAPRAWQALEEVRQHRRPGHLGEARGKGIGRRGNAEHRHHLRPFLAIALIRRVPDALVTLERRDQRADVVACNRMTTVLATAAAEEASQHLVLRRAVQEAHRRHSCENASAHLQRREVSGQEDYTLAEGQCRRDVLASLDLDNPVDIRCGRPPRQRDFQQRNP